MSPLEDCCYSCEGCSGIFCRDVEVSPGEAEHLCANCHYLLNGEAETLPAVTGGDPFAPAETEAVDAVFRTAGVDLYRRFNSRFHNYGKEESA